MIFQLGERYEAQQGQAAKLIEEMTSGRLRPVFLRLHFKDEGSTVVSFDRAHPDRDVIDCKDWSGGDIEGLPCGRVEAVTLEDPFRPLDRSDEVRGEQW
jgi:hypothetical protein